MQRPIVIGILLFLIFVFGISLSDQVSRLLPFSQNLEGFIINDTVSSRDNYYAILTRLDPIIGLPGSNPGSLSESINLLHDAVLSFSPYYTDEEFTLIETFYPKNFLSLLPELERTRVDIIENPNKEKILSYDSKLEDALNTYQNDIDATITALRALPSSKWSTIRYLGGKTSIETIIERLLLAQNGAAQKNIERKNRIDCYMSKGACTALHETLKRLLPEISTEMPTRVIENSNIAAHRDLFLTFWLEYIEQEISAGDSVVTLNTSACFPSNNQNAYLYWHFPTSQSGTYSASRITNLNELYFIDLTTQEEAYPVHLASQGYRLISQPIGNTYTCPDIASEYAKVITTSQGAHFLHNELEEPTEYLDTAVSDALSDHMQTIIVSGESNASEILGNKERVLAIEELLLQQKLASASFESVLLTSVGALYSTEPALANAPPSLQELFIVRFVPSVLFLLANESLVGQPISLFKDREETPIEGFGYIPYSTDAKFRLTEDEIKKSFDAGYTLYSEPFVNALQKE